MHLIFIRHGDPDYKNDSVTQKGKREIELLSERVKSWKVSKVYSSPFGRAQVTAQEVCKGLNCNYEVLDWIREFNYDLRDLKTGKRRIAWDWLPREYFKEKKHFDVYSWFKTKTMRTGNIEKYYNLVCSNFDKLLEDYDYTRIEKKLPVYNCFPHKTKEEALIDDHLMAEQKNIDETNLVFVCHMGVMFAILSHLTGISPVQLWQGFFVAPSSVTIIGTQERIPGEVDFRIQTMGDISHLYSGKESVSSSGYFGHCLSF